ncbi:MULTISPECIES: ATP-dependent helicase [unclassified Bradyrhizobium]|uniref:ATP-dependent helicase n=1 Tax=unclassified Bradyrhizobium TaxID=2631580 RepID=UPI0028F0BD88|nr:MULTISPECIES: ATP-dependent helicase [unclassified Bradyrhizobium]
MSSTAAAPAIYVPSPQQAAFQDEAWNGTSSIVLIAVAGAGKSTTIVHTVSRMRGSSVILAFGRKIAAELKDKLQKLGIDWKKAEASTCHAIALRNLRKDRRFSGVRIDEEKVGRITAGWIDTNRIDASLAPHVGVVVQLVGLAKQSGIGIPGCGDIEDTSVWEDLAEHFDLFDEEALEKKADDLIDLAIEVLNESNSNPQVIDFNDMIYLALLYRVKMWQYDTVIIDEAQDTNTVRRLLARALMKPNTGRLFAVGDPHQAIFGFTGADNDSLDIIKQEFGAKEMPLTVTYRCPKTVVKFAQTWVNHIQAHPSAPEGRISLESFEQMIQQRDRLNGDSAILCRNTRPLVNAAFALIREKVPCRIEGRDIGEQLKKLATRWKSINTIPELEDKLEDWLEKEKERWLPKKKMSKVQEAEDKFETLKVIMDACREDKHDSISAVVAYIDNIFADNVEGILTLATIHRSKGREWKRVYWLDRFGTCPSKYASMPWEKEQEINLQYVAATRAMDELIDLMPPLPKVKPVNDNQQPAQGQLPLTQKVA